MLWETNMYGSVIMDGKDSFREWKIGLTSAVAVKQMEPYELDNGVIVY